MKKNLKYQKIWILFLKNVLKHNSQLFSKLISLKANNLSYSASKCMKCKYSYSEFNQIGMSGFIDLLT